MKTKPWQTVILCGIVLFSFTSLSVSQIPVTIPDDVETEFGTYHPIPVQFTPQVPEFQLESDFSNVTNYNSLGWWFNATDMSLLLDNHFTVKKSQYKQLYEVYNACTWDGTPIFVTADAVLHTYHVLFDYFLSEIEARKFVAALSELTDAMILNIEADYPQLMTAQARDAALSNLAYFYVARKLLSPDDAAPAEIADVVDAELALIDAHEGFSFSPIFGEFSKLDYSQFKPRGHYTKSETLQVYFKTMMWYGWTIFTMEPQLFGEIAARHSLQALLMVQDIYTLQGAEASLETLWDSIYEPTVFFVGRTDDPNIRDYRILGEQIYGDNFLTLSGDSLANAHLLDAFMAQAQTLPEPKIPNWIHGAFITYKGFRFMGQRFIPDSYWMAHLIDPYVRSRYFPKGLDVLAILGSARACALMDSVYHETSPGYAEKIAEFRAELMALNPEQWAQNLYWNWLYCLLPLLGEKGAGYPLFMQTLAWADKELLTALASWAELRHDTILYAKQSMTPCGTTPGTPKSYVEPNPLLYARLASLVQFTKDGLSSRNLLLDGFDVRLDSFERLLLFLKDISIKELESIPLTDTDYENIFCFGSVMQDLVSVTLDPNNPFNRDVDDMAVVADVHTDSNSEQCLEEGVGYPLEIYVIVNEGGDIRLTRGAIFSYYEFTQPIADRLTDEKWRQMLVSDAPPKMPEWVSGFVNVNEEQPEYSEFSPGNLFNHLFLSVERIHREVKPKTTQLLTNYPNPFNPRTTIQYQLDKAAFVRLEIYNINGHRIRTLVNEVQTSGVYAVRWDGRDESGRAVASGVYFCAMKSGDYAKANKLFLLR
ncbi:MAG: DUF3160 domain-containing protein [Candidatus Zhuqueibacterota bacterium]